MQEIFLVQLGFVKSGFFDWENTCSVFISEPDFIALFINHPGRCGRVAHLKFFCKDLVIFYVLKICCKEKWYSAPNQNCSPFKIVRFFYLDQI